MADGKTEAQGASQSHMSWWGAEAAFQFVPFQTGPPLCDGPGAAGLVCNPLSASLTPAPSSGPAVFDFHQAVDGLQEVQRQAQEGKK